MRVLTQGFVATAPSVLAAAGSWRRIEVAMTPDAYVILLSAALPMVLCHLAYAPCSAADSGRFPSNM